jgi:hypothetical protein
LNGGKSPAEVARLMYTNSQSVNGSDGISKDQAKGMVNAAIEDLC